MKNKKLEEMIARVDAEVEREGGSTGSNLREPPYIPPWPTKIPDYLPEEEKKRRQAAYDEWEKINPWKNKK